MVRARLPAKPLISVSGREPRTGNSEMGGPGAGTVRARFPAKPLISVPRREPRAGNSEIGGPGAGTVRARLPAKPLISVPRREPRTARFGNGGPGPRTVCSSTPAKPYVFVPGSKFFTQLPAGKCNFAGDRAARFAPQPPLGLIPSFRGANSSHNFRPESAISPAARPANCSPFLAKPYSFVSGSKFFTQLPAGKCDFACGPAGRFAPRSSLSLIPSFRGANSSHNFRPKSAVSPAIGPAFSVSVLLVLDRKKQCATFLSTSHTASL